VRASRAPIQMVNNELRMTATTYGPYEFWPGPLDDAGNPPADCTPYDRIYEITRDDLAAYNSTGLLLPPPHGSPVVHEADDAGAVRREM